MHDDHPETFTGAVERDAIETSGITGTSSPSADSDAPAIANLMGSAIPGTLAPQPEPDDIIPRIPIAQLDTAKTPALDARSHRGHEQIRGAVRYDPKALLTEERLVLPFARENLVVVYADDDDAAAQLAAKLREQGYRKAGILEGGFDAYCAAGLPTEGVTEEQPIPGHERSGIQRL